MPEPTVEQVLNIDKTQQPKQTPSALLTIIALFFLPPLGIFLAWREKSHHYIYAAYVGLLGLLTAGYGLFIYFFVYPKLLSVYQGLGQTVSQSNILFKVTLIILLSFVQLVGGYLSYRKATEIGHLNTTWLAFLTLLLAIVNFFIIPALIGSLIVSLILPLYQTTTVF
jgi:hypothetical protein